jgi:hypothetical protein
VGLTIGGRSGDRGVDQTQRELAAAIRPWFGALVPPDEVRSLVEIAGFTVDLWLDLSQDAIGFFETLAQAPPPTASRRRRATWSRTSREERTRRVRAVATVT